MDAGANSERLRAALELFDAGRYHDAHELLDELWESTSGPDSDFYKGLIQAAICLHHWSEGNLDGARKLYSGHRKFLAAYLPRHHGVDVADLLAQMQRVLAPVLRAKAGERVSFDAAARPRLGPPRA